MKKLSIIIPVRGRNIIPLLSSLEELDEVVEIIPVYYVGGLWNVSRAANIGIRKSRGEIVAKVDADVVIPNGFIDDILGAGNCFCVAPVVMLKKDDSIEEAKYLPVHRPPDLETVYWPCGAWQSAPRDFWFDTRGYDEDMILYGAEDTDMWNRAQLAGLKREVLGPIPHRWHESKAGKYAFFHAGNAKMREARKETLVRNRSGWGGAQMKKGDELFKWFLNVIKIISVNIRDGSVGGLER